MAEPYLSLGPSCPAGRPPGGPPVSPRPADADDAPAPSRAVTWLRLLKLLLSTLLVALAIVEALRGLGLV